MVAAWKEMVRETTFSFAAARPVGYLSQAGGPEVEDVLTEAGPFLVL
jgi:hypothetical protein